MKRAVRPIAVEIPETTLAARSIKVDLGNNISGPVDETRHQAAPDDLLRNHVHPEGHHFFVEVIFGPENPIQRAICAEDLVEIGRASCRERVWISVVAACVPRKSAQMQKAHGPHAPAATTS